MKGLIRRKLWAWESNEPKESAFFQGYEKPAPPPPPPPPPAAPPGLVAPDPQWVLTKSTKLYQATSEQLFGKEHCIFVLGSMGCMQVAVIRDHRDFCHVHVAIQVICVSWS